MNRFHNYMNPSLLNFTQKQSHTRTKNFKNNLAHHQIGRRARTAPPDAPLVQAGAARTPLPLRQADSARRASRPGRRRPRSTDAVFARSARACAAGAALPWPAPPAPLHPRRSTRAVGAVRPWPAPPALLRRRRSTRSTGAATPAPPAPLRQHSSAGAAGAAHLRTTRADRDEKVMEEKEREKIR
ncbi:unnamed protein product [Urochloa humidicola]